MCLPTSFNNGIDIEAASASALPLADDKESQIPDHVEIVEEKICYLESSEQSKKNDIYKARALVFLVATFYGTVSVGMTNTLRFGLAAIVTSPWLFSNFNQIIRQWSTSPEAAAMIAGFEAGLWNFIGFTAQAVGLQTISASHKMRLNQIAGIVLAILGVGVLGFAEMDLSTGSLLSHGDLFSLIQPLAFGMARWRTGAAMQKYPSHALRASAAQQIAIFLASAMYTAFSRNNGIDIPQIHAAVTNPVMLGSLLWTGIVTTALSTYMVTVSMKTLTAAEATLFLSFEPVAGSLLAAALLGERLGFDGMIGSGLILVSCIMSTPGFAKLQWLCKKEQDTTVVGLDDECNHQKDQDTTVNELDDEGSDSTTDA